MKYFLFTFLLFLVLFSKGQSLVILHTNDMHSHLNGFSPEAEYTPLIDDEDPTAGGFSRIAGLIQSEKEKYGESLLVLDAGDFSMGTLFQTLEMTEGFQLNLMKKMGYEFVAIGNHEFDYGPNTLATMINNNLKNGPIPQLLCANYAGSKLYPDDLLQKSFDDGVILPYSVIVKNGIKIGLFGLVGVDADESIASYFGVQFDKQKKVAKATAKYLKKTEKVDLVIALSHSGVWKNKKGKWSGEDLDYAKAAPDIDLIISGHTHTYLPIALHAGNATIVQTGALGLNVGKVSISMKEDHRPQIDYELVAMNDKIIADPEIQQLIDSKTSWIEKNILMDAGSSFSKPILETSFDLTMDENHPFESNLGPFIADAIYHSLNQDKAPKVDMAMVATGVIRTNIYTGKKGLQNINDLFNVMPLGNGDDQVPGSSLGKIYVTGSELKKVLELILAVYPMKTNYYLYYSGAQIEFNPDKGFFKKISAIKIGDEEKGFRTLDIGKKSQDLVSIAANKYMISFIGQLKKMSFGLVNVIPKRGNGVPFGDDSFLVDLDDQKEGVQEAKEWLSIYHYIKEFSDVNGNGIPDVPEVYQTKRNPLLVVKQ
ncbi:MAG: bifunctional UDP-sugar hydrolase/5'-nucleotidase [Prolixibacteraceae bacterium]